MCHQPDADTMEFSRPDCISPGSVYGKWERTALTLEKGLSWSYCSIHHTEHLRKSFWPLLPLDVSSGLRHWDLLKFIHNINQQELKIYPFFHIPFFFFNMLSHSSHFCCDSWKDLESMIHVFSKSSVLWPSFPNVLTEVVVLVVFCSSPLVKHLERSGWCCNSKEDSHNELMRCSLFTGLSRTEGLH